MQDDPRLAACATKLDEMRETVKQLSEANAEMFAVLCRVSNMVATLKGFCSLPSGILEVAELADRVIAGRNEGR